MSPHVDFDSLKRVAVFRALQVGDMLCAVPALRALRARAPHAKITLIGLPWAKSFAQRFARYLDAFIAFPGFPGMPERPADICALPAFFARCQASKFDLALQLHGSGEVTNALVALLGARTSTGFHVEPAFRLDLSFPYPANVSEVERCLILLEAIGAPAKAMNLEFPLLPADRSEIAALPESAQLRNDYVCIHPGARDAARRWPAHHFAVVADALADLGFRIVITGSQAETKVAHAVVSHMRHPPLNIARDISLGGLAAVLAGARLLVCNDTGVSHIAAALRVPSVVIFLASDPVRWAPLDRALHRTVIHPALCASCGDAHPCSIRPQTVIEHAKRLLHQERPVLSMP